MPDGEELKRFIEGICRRFGPRVAGSAAEAGAADAVRAELESCGATAAIEEFPLPQRSLHGFLVVPATGLAASLALYFVCPWASASLMLVALAVFFSRLIFGKDVTALFRKPATSANVVARMAPAGKRERLLIFSGHHDSAFRMPLLARPTRRVVFVLLPLLTAAVLAMLGLSVFASLRQLLAPGAAGGRGAVELALLCFCGAGVAAAVVLLAGMVRGDAVQGANDNLSAVAVAVGVARRLAAARPARTEVWFVSFGAEEAGLVGSKSFVARHRGELGDALVVNLESLGQRGTLRVVSGELMNLTMHSPRARALLADAARAAGKGTREKYLSYGLTDAASFSLARLHAATLIRLDETDYFDYYHQPGDEPGCIRAENLAEALEVCMKAVELVDEGA